MAITKKLTHEERYELLCEEREAIAKEIIKYDSWLGTWIDASEQDHLNAIEKRVAETKRKELSNRLAHFYQLLEEKKAEIDVHLGVGQSKTDVEEPLSVGQEE